MDFEGLQEETTRFRRLVTVFVGGRFGDRKNPKVSGNALDVVLFRRWGQQVREYSIYKWDGKDIFEQSVRLLSRAPEV